MSSGAAAGRIVGGSSDKGIGHSVLFVCLVCWPTYGLRRHDEASIDNEILLEDNGPPFQICRDKATTASSADYPPTGKVPCVEVESS